MYISVYIYIYATCLSIFPQTNKFKSDFLFERHKLSI